MNLCFEIGKVIEEVEFEFLYEGKRKSIAYTKLQLNNGSIIPIKAYDIKADRMYQNIEKNNIVLVEGKIVNKANLEIEVLRYKEIIRVSL